MCLSVSIEEKTAAIRRETRQNNNARKIDQHLPGNFYSWSDLTEQHFHSYEDALINGSIGADNISKDELFSSTRNTRMLPRKMRKKYWLPMDNVIRFYNKALGLQKIRSYCNYFVHKLLYYIIWHKKRVQKYAKLIHSNLKFGINTFSIRIPFITRKNFTVTFYLRG